MSRLRLYPVPGEAPGEVVFYAPGDGYTLWLKHEYPAALWEWIIVQGRVPIALGEEADQATAELRLNEAVAEFCPDFRVTSDEEKPPGLLGRLWRAL